MRHHIDFSYRAKRCNPAASNERKLNKQPGEFRTSQNWIGGATLQDAVFIPPVHTSIGALMSDLERFVHNEEILLPDLLKIALVHYQFETAKQGIATFDAILQLQQEVDAKVQPLGSRAENARAVIRALYQRPLTDAKRVAAVTGLSPTSAYNLIDDLEDLGILHEITGAKRGRQYVFADYLHLFTR